MPSNKKAKFTFASSSPTLAALSVPFRLLSKESQSTEGRTRIRKEVSERH
jgi:hypothetical protein